MKEEMTPKQQEIKLLDDLKSLDGYFADTFGNCIEQMKENIKSDFPIMFNTWVENIKFELDQARLEIDTWKRNFKELADTSKCFEHELNDKKEEQKMFAINVLVRASKTGDSELEELACTILGRDTAISFKVKNDIPLSEADKCWLVNYLEK